jgi:hypothetical protein
MAFEIVFMPVGEGEKSGDAIAMRFGNICAKPPQQTVVVIDCGTKDSGAALVEHIKGFYMTTTVAAILCTHSAGDHASGLTEAIESCEVGRLVMHLPWSHVAELDKLLKNAEMSNNSLERHFKKSLDQAHELESLAKKKGIPIFEPFSDNSKASDTFCILGPSVAFYENLLESFRCADELVPTERFLEKDFAKAAKAVRWLIENWPTETLVEPPEDACSAENNSTRGWRLFQLPFSLNPRRCPAITVSGLTIQSADRPSGHSCQSQMSRSARPRRSLRERVERCRTRS